MGRKRKKKLDPENHRGVTLLPRRYPSGRVSWRAKWIDPQSGRTKWVTLERIQVTNEDQRYDWAVAQATTNAYIRRKILAGESIHEDVDLADALEQLIERKKLEVSDSTIWNYKQSAKVLLFWAKKRGIKTTGRLNRSQLADLRTFIIALPKRISMLGAKRGATVASSERRSPFSTSRDIRQTKVMLRQLRRVGQLPNVDVEALQDSLKEPRTPNLLPTFLHAPEVRRLLEAAIRHDVVTHTMTRAEKAGEREIGTSPRFKSIAPFLLTVLLTGARFGEIAGLQWIEVDLREGEIRLEARRVKTRSARIIRFDITPSLGRLLAALRLRAGEGTHVFGGTKPMPRDRMEAGRKRMISDLGAPKFTWQELRRTCGTYLTCAPGVFGAASAFLSAKRLGHSVIVAEKHYLGAVAGIDPAARTLEQVFGAEELADRIVRLAGGQPDELLAVGG
jgi:integrase